MPSPRVTVVVIVRDGERFLAEALESILVQEFDRWEAIVVDDGSIDGSRAIAERFAAADGERFRLVRHPDGANRGMSASRNLGIRHARGEYITFLDHDDRMLPAKLASQVADLDRHAEAVATVGPNLRWRSWTGGGTQGTGDTVQDLGVALDRVHAPPGPLPVFLARTSATPQAPMVRRAAIDRVGGFDEAFRDMYEDQVFLAKIFLGGGVHITSSVLQHYRQHDASCVHLARRRGRHLAARAQFLSWLSGYLANAPVPPAVRIQVAQVVRRERLRLWWHRVRNWTRLRR